MRVSPDYPPSVAPDVGKSSLDVNMPGLHALSRIRPTGITFSLTKKSENFIQAFSIRYKISAFFFAQTYPTGPNPADNPRASLDGNADHDRMSAGRTVLVGA
jgi:hypothetical protein